MGANKATTSQPVNIDWSSCFIICSFTHMTAELGLLLDRVELAVCRSMQSHLLSFLGL